MDEHKRMGISITINEPLYGMFPSALLPYTMDKKSYIKKIGRSNNNESLE